MPGESYCRRLGSLLLCLCAASFERWLTPGSVWLEQTTDSKVTLEMESVCLWRVMCACCFRRWTKQWRGRGWRWTLESWTSMALRSSRRMALSSSASTMSTKSCSRSSLSSRSRLSRWDSVITGYLGCPTLGHFQRMADPCSAGETSERPGRAHMGFPELVDTLLNCT